MSYRPVLNLVSHRNGGTNMEGISEQGTEENV